MSNKRNSVSLALQEFLWPTRCALCDTPGEIICESCLAQLDYIDYWQACPRCGAAFGARQCSACAMRRLKGDADFAFERCVSAVIMDAQAARLALLRKDAAERRLAWVLAACIAQVIPPEWVSAETLLCAPPVRYEALRERGFNHNADLVYGIAHLLGLKSCELFAPIRAHDQRVLNYDERRANMGSLQFASSVPANAQRLIIVDDVFTTGATLDTCARAVRAVNPDLSIFAATFAHGY